MRQTTFLAGISLLTLTAGATLPAFAQTTRDTTRYSMPYEKNFWSYGGITAGQSKFKQDCVSGFSCDDTGTGFKIYGGGKFREAIGLELGIVDLGKGKFGGGDVQARGLNVSAVFALPVGQYSDLHAKLGVTYGEAKAIGAKERGWEPSGGVGAAIGINRNWQVVVDWDRFRFEFPGTKENVDMLSAGVQFRF